MEWSNDVIIEFLDLYEGEPAIWNLQHSDYKDRNKIDGAWKWINEKLGVECTLHELKKKKENLMPTYPKIIN